jgi:hypothetical protein
VALLRTEPGCALVLIQRFSMLALWCVIVIAESGLLNASLRLASMSDFVGTFYGSLILVKICLLGWLIRLGWVQRSRVVPRITQGAQGGSELLARYAAWEIVVMGIAIAISVVLSRVGPAPAGVATGDFAPVSLVMLAIAAPLLMIWAAGVEVQQASKSRGLAWLRSQPEIVSVALLVVVAEVAGVQPLQSVFGTQLATVTGSVLILLAGACWAVAASGDRGQSAIVIVMIGWPVVVWLDARLQVAAPNANWRLTIVCALLAEAMLGWSLVRLRRRLQGRRSGKSHDIDPTSTTSVDMAGFTP